MANKLFPPFIEQKLPAFADTINIEFEMNRSVGIEEVFGMSLIVKTAQTGSPVGTIRNNDRPTYNPSTGKYLIIFKDLGNLNLQIGQYYKIQLAYIDIDGQEGYYSSAGIIKKTTRPALSILSLNTTLSNILDYTAFYSQKTDKNGQKDSTEKLYSYRFDIYDLNDNMIDTSGECLYNSENNTSEYESVCVWKSNVDLPKETNYKILFSVTTINGLQSSISEIAYVEESVDIDIAIDLLTELNYEDGIIKLFLQSSNFKDVVVTGNFVLTRSSSASNFNQWDPIYSFSYTNIIVNTPILLWEDYSVQQGETYIYAIQAYNNRGLYSNRKLAKNEKIKADFEHCFLSDANHQLKIAFNSKISSIKNTVMESKIDTLGSKYPFIFRNGYVNYKEFPISGLLSLLTDENEKFMSFNKQPLREKRISTPGSGEGKLLGTNLTGENIYNERLFKLEVLNWLNNGEPKIFRSPTEGNYIVRLMNSSLTPNETLGRMLHTFNSTAYEMADWNFNNLKDYGLIRIPLDKKESLKIGQVRPTEVLDAAAEGTLAKKYPGFSISSSKHTIYFPNVYSVNITEAKPGTVFRFHIANREPQDIEIGGTGSYFLQIGQAPNSKNDTYLTAIGNLSSLSDWSGVKITYEYYDETSYNTFSEIAKIDSLNEIRRYIGYDYNVNIIQPTEQGASSNILADIRREIGLFNFIKVEKRYIQEVWKTADGRYARNKAGTDIITEDEWNDVIIYHVNDTDLYYSGKISTSNRLKGIPDCRFCLNNSITDFSDFSGRTINENSDSPFTQTIGKIDSIRNVKVETLRIGNGLLLDIGYRVRLKTYSVELDNKNEYLIERKNVWIKKKKDLKELLSGVSYTQINITENQYDPTKHYYYSVSEESYVKGATTYYDNRAYYIKNTDVIPTKQKIDQATSEIHAAYIKYINELNLLLVNSREKSGGKK